jgi:hypothetical protein
MPGETESPVGLREQSEVKAGKTSETSPGERDLVWPSRSVLSGPFVPYTEGFGEATAPGSGAISPVNVRAVSVETEAVRVLE